MPSRTRKKAFFRKSSEEFFLTNRRQKSHLYQIRVQNMLELPQNGNNEK
jgi:hypothetical protein